MKNLLKTFLECTALLALALLIVFLFAPNAKAEYATDYHNHELSEQISQEWREQAKREWIAEYGEFQPNLTEQSENYLKQQTYLKQEEINARLQL